MNTVTFAAPFTDADMEYNSTVHRYVLTEEYVRSRGIDLGLELNTDGLPEPSKASEMALERVSMLVYNNIYNYGRTKSDKEYLLACNPNLREIIKEAMFERLKYMLDSGDLSTRSGALVSQGTRVETRDLIPSVVEEMILRSAGLLHRGEYFLIKDETITY